MADGLPSRGLDSQQAGRSRRTERTLMVMRTWWRSFTRSLARGYRPERYYMRGPGPKSLDRNSRIAG
jgi:hypothetical protein